jgi:O2-independent ubiquinone biosynthesis protein UbiV
VNGVQTLSAGAYCLVDELEALREAGVSLLRVSPQSQGTPEVLQVLRAAMDGHLSGFDARKALAALAPGALWNGFWHGRPGMQAA